jgi:hypothetical protein
MRRRMPIRPGWEILLSVLIAAAITAPVAQAHRGGPYATADRVAPDPFANWARGTTHPVRQPDGRIRLAGGPLVGNDIYNATGVHQSRKVETFSPLPGQSYTFRISIQNDAAVDDAFKIAATGAPHRGWKAKYFRGTANITAALIAGTYLTPTLAPGATFRITATATATDFSDSSLFSRLVTATSAADATKADTVRFVVKIVPCGC